MLTTLAIENYRSLRRLVVPLGRLSVVTGANGTGKSGLYRALRLLADSARNGAVAALAREGGLPSTLWAGPQTIAKSVRRGDHPVQGTVPTRAVSLKLGFAGDEYGYGVDFGLPRPSDSAFSLDPEIKREWVWAGPLLRPAALLAERHEGAVRIRADRDWIDEKHQLRPYDSMLSEFADPDRAPELLRVREQVRSWRFYDHVRTDADAPARGSRVGTRTPVLSQDGSDLAAALQTIREIGPPGALETAIDEAFPGSTLAVRSEAGLFTIAFHQHGLLRPLSTAELSDGTLRYLLWVAALLSPRPPELLVLNEPETSLHPDLLPALAGLIAGVAEQTQVVVVTHAAALLDALAAKAGEVETIELRKDFGETVVAGREGVFDQPAWTWPSR